MQHPRVKFPHRPVRLVQVGGIVPGIGAIVPDPHGWVWDLLLALDGTRTVEQVIADVLASHPQATEHDLRRAIHDLAGYLEDADRPEPVGVAATDRERYSRSVALFGWIDRVPGRTGWEVQRLLWEAKVAVVGVGGVGGAAALALTASGVGHVHCVDGDVVELSDLNRQFLYTEQDVGSPKVEAAVRRLRAYNSGVHVSGQVREIDGPDALTSLATQFDVLVLAVDRPAIRSWTNRACLDTAKPWVLGGYHGPLVAVGLYLPGTGPCYECGYADERPRREAQPSRTEVVPAAGVESVHAASAVTAGMSGCLAAHAAISLITGAPVLPVNRQYAVNLVTLVDSFALGPESPVHGCPACSGRD